MMLLRWLAGLAVAFSLLSGVAHAHPHVFVDAKAEIVFDTAGRISAVRHIWRFDEAFSSYATLNLDLDGDGQIGEAELVPLAKVNVESLHEYDFFTYLAIGGSDVAFTDVSDYFLTYDGTQLTLYYTLPLMTPAAVTAQAKLEVYDPEYFVAFNFVDDDPATLIDAPATCAATYHPPQEIDDATMAMLNALPADQRELPDDLSSAASALANSITIDCITPASAPAAAATPADAPRAKPPSPFGVGTTDTTTGSGFLMASPLGPFFAKVAAYQAEFYRALTGTFADIKADGRAAWLLLGLSFLYGIFHAAGPGHGKAVITSYLFATGESVRRGIWISLLSAFVQAFSAIAIVVVAAVIFRAAAATMTVATVWIETASYALIVLVGLWLLWSKTFGGGHHHHHHHHHHHDHGAAEGRADPTHQPSAGPPSPERGGMADLHPPEGEHTHGHAHEPHEHDHAGHSPEGHGHAHHHHEGHAHAHHHAPVRAAKPSQSGLIAAVLAVGIRPCSGAIIVLVFALSQGMLAVGIASTLVMAVGTGLTVAVLATLAVSAHGFAMRLAGAESVWGYRIVRGLEILAALAVLLLGLVLLGGALATVQMPG